ncbi:MAG TPA: type II secretion system F family protein, partial [Candidatus Micrarchaeota archaeon]|nr:type II secretion system F family protein [Candidatus Micrarchaeota archaeon]
MPSAPPIPFFSAQNALAAKLAFALSPIRRAFDFLTDDFSHLGWKTTPVNYAIVSLLDSAIAGIAIFIATYIASGGVGQGAMAIAGSLLPAVAAFALTFGFYIALPGLEAGDNRDKTDKELVYALKDLSVQISGGVGLYDAMLNISRSGYGPVSEEFGTAIREISSGIGEDEALMRMAQRSKSEYLKRAVWQMTAVMKSGGSLQTALLGIVSSLRSHQSERITTYLQEMNLWVLVYLVAAIA